MVHMPLFKLKIPKNTMVLVQEVINIATFDIPYVNVPDIFGDEVFPGLEEVMH
jgi:hypothetical protein